LIKTVHACNYISITVILFVFFARKSYSRPMYTRVYGLVKTGLGLRQNNFPSKGFRSPNDWEVLGYNLLDVGCLPSLRGAVNSSRRNDSSRLQECSCAMECAFVSPPYSIRSPVKFILSAK